MVLIYTILIIILFIGESLSPMKRFHSSRYQHIFKNMLIFAIARGVLFTLSLLALERFSFYSLKSTFGSNFFIYVFIVSDLSVYWWHRLNHRVPFLWRFHQVHHSDIDLDFSSALRFHFGELTLSYFTRGGVYLLLGFEVPEVLFYNLVLTCANLFHHSNILLPQKLELFLSRFLVTPKFHRTHHSKYLAHNDSNYSALWTGWDHLFRSFTGIKPTEEVGVPYLGQTDFKVDLILPFKKLQVWPAAFKGEP